MSFSKSYEPGEYESDIYAAWEAAGVFEPTPIDNHEEVFRKAPENVHSRPCATNGERNERLRPVTTGSKERVENGAFLAPSDNTYSIVMPPPNANGNLHIGHGLTIALEDSLTRYHRLLGDSTWFIPGADHAGFETWVVYERELEKHGHTRFEYDRNELYARVWDFVAQQRGNMELQLRALGASCAWDDLTFTLDENVIDRVYTTFEKMWNDGLIYRGEKLVNFCPKHQTAFADIEVDHKDEKGTLWEIEYELVKNDRELEDGASRGLPEVTTDRSRSRVNEELALRFEATPLRTTRRVEDEGASAVTTGASDPSRESTISSSQHNSLIVSTTRPETLFGDTAIAVNPDDDCYKGLIGKHVSLPLTNKTVPIIADEHADPEYGTGVVKITPAHDFDDFEVGERHNLPRIQVISEEGTMINVPEKYQGLTTKECRKQVLKDLKEQGLLKGEKKIEHSVAHCYKCDTVLEPTLKEQWFIDVKKLAKTAIEHLNNDEIKFHPASKKQVLINYLENLKDWNISRQIPWGIAIPMFKRADLARAPESGAIATIRDNGSGTSEEPRNDGRDEACRNSATSGATANPPAWIFDRRTDLKEIEKSGIKYIRDEDTFDTWFSSSHWPIVCTDWSEDNPTPYYPLNVMETGADILFAWVARMIMMGLYVTGEVPFKEVYLHGLVLDAHGQKMSKSKGNVINPMDLVTKYGSDAFRLGILRGRSAGMNQAFSENSVISGRNLCNKLWNITRLIQSIVDDNSDKSKAMSSRDGSLEPVVTGLAPSSSVVTSGSPRKTSSLDLSSLTDRKELENSNFTTIRDNGSGTSEEPRNDGRDEACRENAISSSYQTLNMGEDWICREINDCLSQVEQNMRDYKFSEAVEILYQTIWDKYADWFLESQKIFKNTELLKTTLEAILIAFHPFAPFLTETIWQNLSWTEGFIITAKWPEKLKYDPISAEQFETIITIVNETRATLQALPGTNNAKKYELLYDNDSIVNDNQILIKALTKVPAINSLDGSPRGLRLALANHELYLDVPEKIVKEYKDALTEKILAVGRELDALNARMMNPNYVNKAPAHLVKETQDGIKEKEALISRLKQQLNLI